MKRFDYDLFVLGGGSGGVRVARWSGGLGASVAICEEDRFGGTCVIRGCIPKKFMVMASHLPEEVAAMRNYGWSVTDLRFDWEAFKIARDREIDRLSGLYERMLEKNGVARLYGRGTLIDPHTIEVDGKRVTARHIVIAVGGKPDKPPIPGIELAMTSNGVFELSRQPARVLIGGGGYIAVEFAGIFNGLGSRVTQVVRGPMLLRGFDGDAAEHLRSEMTASGIRLMMSTTIESISRAGDALEVRTSDGSTLEVDAVLAAMGRTPNTQGLGLEEIGVRCGEKGEILVDDRHRTSVESVFAIGDCTDRVNLTPVALAEGTMLAENLFGGKDRRMSYANIPSAVFSQPPLAAVGCTEEQAHRAGGDGYEVYESRFRPLKHTLSGLEKRTYMKLIVDRASRKVVGCHIVGDDAPEILQAVAIAVRAGATKEDFDATIGIHPTSAEELCTLRTPRE